MPTGKYTCPECDVAFDGSLSFQAHIWVEHGGHGGIECAFCARRVEVAGDRKKTCDEIEVAVNAAYDKHMQKCTAYAATMLAGKVFIKPRRVYGKEVQGEG